MQKSLQLEVRVYFSKSTNRKENDEVERVAKLLEIHETAEGLFLSFYLWLTYLSSLSVRLQSNSLFCLKGLKGELLIFAA